MNVIRMIKLFGWEQKMAEQLNLKRIYELVLIRKFKLIWLVGYVLK